MFTPPTHGLPWLLASRRLSILDDLRVPYASDQAYSAVEWAWVSAGDPERSLHWFMGEGSGFGCWWLNSTPIWGRLADDAAVLAHTRELRGRWRPELPIVDGRGVVRAHVWRGDAGGTILPFDPDAAIEALRTEGYRESGRARGPSPAAVARRAYYTARPLLPRRAQMGLRRAFSRLQARSAFPRWPVEPALHDLADLVLARLAEARGGPVPYIAPWPTGRSWALVLTHDVEHAAGLESIEPLRRIEADAGLRSAWYLVPERYGVDDPVVERLDRLGCEVGVHGLRHDGRDLESLRTLRRRLPAIRSWAERWGASGFRAPALHHVAAWMPMLGFDYDTSCFDTDPYEPMPGGCCSWLPYFNQDLVELPVTLTQDHTVFVLLRRDESLWREKAERLRERGGMALLITHPDYMLEPARLEAYERFVGAFADDPTVWAALPREVAAWWRRRAATSLQLQDGRWEAVGPGAEEAAVRYASPASEAGSPPSSSAGPDGPVTRSPRPDAGGRRSHLRIVVEGGTS